MAKVNETETARRRGSSAARRTGSGWRCRRPGCTEPAHSGAADQIRANLIISCFLLGADIVSCCRVSKIVYFSNQKFRKLTILNKKEIQFFYCNQIFVFLQNWSKNVKNGIFENPKIRPP